MKTMPSILRPGAIAVSLSLLALVGCTWGFGGEEPSVTDMHRQLSRTVDIQTGVVLGDLTRARDAAAWLATHEELQSFPEGSDHYRARMRGYAGLIAQANTLGEVAARTGQMAAACGSCHQETRSGPRFVMRSQPPRGTELGSQMVRHIWAADRMWEGLVGPSDEAWQAGAEALEDAWLPVTVLSVGYGPRGEVDGMIGEIRSLAVRAQTAGDQEERARLYGEMLGTCSRCHGQGGVMVER